MKKRKFHYYLISLLSIILFSLNTFSKEKNYLININKGIGSIELGINEQNAIKLLKTKPIKTGVDKEYEGQTVYYSFFGEKNIDNIYELEIYSDVNKKVFIIVINSPSYCTKEGLSIGSTEQDLLKIYSKNLKRTKAGKIYTKYSLGNKRGTDFYVKNEKITQIIIRDY